MAAVLIREEEGEQLPIYYISKVLHEAELNYPRLEKLVYALLIATQKLRHYFEAHLVVVRIDSPLRKVLQKAEASGRIAEWVIHIESLGVTYEPQKALKAQVLADFIA